MLTHVSIWMINGSSLGSHHWGAAIAQWISLHLPPCCPGFESQARQIRFFILHFEKNENKQKEAGFGPY